MCYSPSNTLLSVIVLAREVCAATVRWVTKGSWRVDLGHVPEDVHSAFGNACNTWMRPALLAVLRSPPWVSGDTFPAAVGTECHCEFEHTNTVAESLCVARVRTYLFGLPAFLSAQFCLAFELRSRGPCKSWVGAAQKRLVRTVHRLDGSSYYGSP